MRAVVAGLGAALLALTGCGGGESARRTVTVLAASSLSGVVERLATQYERAHPGVDVRVSTGGSADLVAQLAAGLRADVLATADERTMASATRQGLVEAPTVVSSNTLTLVTAPGNPLHLTSLADAGRHALVVCAPAVPCGSAARRLAAASGVPLHPRSEEQNVTAALEKVRAGQADAGVVYVTDARAAGAAVTAVPLAGADAVVNRQEAAATPTASDDGRSLLALLTGAEGRAVLRDAGFGTT